MRCPNCGEEFDPGKGVCEHCGVSSVSLTQRNLSVKDPPQGKSARRYLPILFSIIMLVVGSIAIWQGLRLIADQNKPQIDNEVAQSNLEHPSSQVTQTKVRQTTVTPELLEVVVESPIPEPPIGAGTLQVNFAVDLVEITAANALLVEELARIGDGKIAIFDFGRQWRV